MTTHVFTSPFVGYDKILSTIISDGEEVPSRAGDTLEIENATFTFNNSAYAVPPKRPGFSPLLGFM